MQRPHESAMAQPCKNNISCIYFAPIPSCFLPPRSFSCIYCASFPWLWCFARPSVLSLLATSLAAPQSSATTSSHFHVIFRGVKGSVRDWRMHNNTPPPTKKKIPNPPNLLFCDVRKCKPNNEWVGSLAKSGL